MTRRLIILGTRGLAREMALLAEHVNTTEDRWHSVDFVGDTSVEVGKSLGPGTIVGDDAWLLAQDFEADLVIGIGYPKVREKALAPYLAQGDRFGYPNLVHPSATYDPQGIKMGFGNTITAGCRFTCDIVVGNFNLFNLNATVGHDVRIENYNVINPGVNVSGGVSIDNRVLAGTGCQILEGRSIGTDSVIGAGAVVRQDVLAGQTVVGVPARPLERKTG